MIRAVKADEDKLGLYSRPVLKRHVDKAHDGVPVGDFRYRPIPVHPCLDGGRLQFAVGVADDRPPRPPEPHERLLAEDAGHDLGAAADGFPGAQRPTDSTEKGVAGMEPRKRGFRVVDGDGDAVSYRRLHVSSRRPNRGRWQLRSCFPSPPSPSIRARLSRNPADLFEDHRMGSVPAAGSASPAFRRPWKGMWTRCPSASACLPCVPVSTTIAGIFLPSVVPADVFHVLLGLFQAFGDARFLDAERLELLAEGFARIQRDRIGVGDFLFRHGFRRDGLICAVFQCVFIALWRAVVRTPMNTALRFSLYRMVPALLS